MRTGVTADQVPSASEFPDLLFREKGRRVDVVGRNKKMAAQPEHFEQVRYARHRADPTVIECEKQWYFARRYLRKELSAACKPGLRYGGHLLKVLPELLDIEFV